MRRYPRWWIEVMLRVRMSVLIGQTRQHRLERTPAGEVVARSMDADRYALYADRWVDFLNGLAIVVVTALLGGLAMFAFGSGPIRGFAVSLCLGILSSLYTAVSVSRGISSMIYGGRQKLARLSI